MNWKRGLTRIYVVLWVLFALAGIFVVATTATSDGSSGWVWWVWWAVICLILPAALFWVLNWVASGFRSTKNVAAPRSEPARGIAMDRNHEPVTSSPQPGGTVTSSTRAQFTGKGKDIFSIEGLKMLLWFVSILGMPFGILYMYRWMARNIVLPTGTKIAFVGAVRAVYGFMAASLVVSIFKRWDPLAATSITSAALLWWIVEIVWMLVLLAGQAVVSREYYKWLCRNLSFTPGTHVTFRGPLLPYVGWTILTLFSFFTIIGWAWVTTAFLRWQLKCTDIPGHRLFFRGRGLDLLWRGVVGFGAILTILPIPWIVAWLCRWYIGNIEGQGIPVAATAPSLTTSAVLGSAAIEGTVQ